MSEALTLKVNGTVHTVRVDGDMPLLWLLRDVLGLTGTKYGCGIGECGACTVLVDGDLRLSCQRDSDWAAGSEVTTVEGLGAMGAKLQQAWLDEQVPQCGYCQSGVLVAAAELLARNPKPSDADIEDAIENLCACGTYPRIRRGIKRAAGIV